MLFYKQKLWVFITVIPILLIGCGGGSNETGTDQVPLANSPEPIISNPLPISKPTLPTEIEAIRFLTQASFGAYQNSIQKVQELGYQVSHGDFLNTSRKSKRRSRHWTYTR